MPLRSVTIYQGTIKEVVNLSLQVPEFKNSYPEEEYITRLKSKKSLVLVASYNGKPAGFKVGYDKDEDGSFYSWMGAVIPSFRKLGVAQKLADYQENWAIKNGYDRIRLKTRNYLKPMLIFALQNDFNIINVISYPRVRDNRIVLEKELGFHL
ncbi:GNAT family N-acetyltransferase [Fulvivirga sp. M361]|uniref:GNAT family N-acetyltransferase n=1 Tax=Fulvivirga sp. M361 TaxID=2594266 RepID=UPI00117B06AE|nr:GNAT family N-acetyltransferase [Fulvivirga sp. M361]TRX55959.1 GNAT family N-acetyltransferase [Fulvivirga sp. M361]